MQSCPKCGFQNTICDVVEPHRSRKRNSEKGIMIIASVVVFAILSVAFVSVIVAKPSNSETHTDSASQIQDNKQVLQSEPILSDDSVEKQRVQEELLRQKNEVELQRQIYEKELQKQQYEQIVQRSYTEPLVKGLISDSLNFYIQPVPSYAAEGVQEEVERVAESLDGQTYLDVLFKRVFDEESADLRVYWVKDTGTEHIGWAIGSHVEVGLGAQSCYGEWQPFDATTVTQIMWHELGHSLGFKHSDNPNNIMYYQGNTKFSIDYEDSVFLDEGYYRYSGFCNSGTYYYELSSNDNDGGFEIYVLPPETSPETFVKGDSSAHYYPSCSGEYDVAYSSYSNTCTVPLGATLLIYNRDDLLRTNAIQVNLKIVDHNENDNPNMIWQMEDFTYDEDWLNEIRALSVGLRDN